MKLLLMTAVLCGALAIALGVPVPAANPEPEPVAAANPEPAAKPKTDIELMKIPLDGDQELDVITLVNSEDQRINERNKRTIGILRELFPSISQIVDQKIQMITSYLFRTIGPILLRSGLGLGGGTGGAAGDRGSSSSDDDDDDFNFDDDDDDTDSDSKKPSSSSSSSGGPKVSISLPTFPPSNDGDDDEESGTSTTTAKGPAPVAPRLGGEDSKQDEERNEVRKRATTAAPEEEEKAERIDLLAAGQLDPTTSLPPTTTVTAGVASETESNLITTNEDVNTLDTLDLAGLSDTLNAIRVARATAEEKAASSNDQNAAESSANSSSLDELTLDSEGTDEDRNKRFLSFGGSSGGGGSGNFLFDIIRLVSGSSGTEQSDEKAHSPDDHDLGKGDGYTEGIPGPVTRLFVLANRGLSNLIQDLILRIAQTSERVVNFKARLITSLI
ncbi:dentin sialophosphoprotein-like isoform X4 [Anopheles albimanus]|nr:dentin sialophosphoprotein-like isoform X4 [Anopheles albimanus]